jgi:lipid-A-disaccharide synthase
MERTSLERETPLNPKTSILSIMIVAGEASGDKHGASLARALKRLLPETDLRLFGSGGGEMRAAGVETLVDAREVAVIGVPEIARAIGKLYRAYRTLLGAARSRRPAAVVLIDWPDFNMRLARKLHREGFKVIYYISPQVWAWRKYRIRALRRDVDRMLVILPFEVEFYREAGIEAEYVGHPLAAEVRATMSREEFCRRHGVDPARPIIALLPGSREKEIHYHLPVMLDAARRLIEDRGSRIADRGLRTEHLAFNSQSSNLKSEISNLKSETPNPQSAVPNSQSDNPRSSILNPQFLVPLASTVRREDLEAIMREAWAAPSHSVDRSPAIGNNQLDCKIVECDAYNTLSYSEIAVVASGTATVEAALAGTPMVVIYRASEINWRLIRPLIHLDTFGMVNLIAGRRIVPELMQREATGERIAREVTAILSDQSRVCQMREDLKLVRDVLKAGGLSGAERAANAVIEVIRES